MLHVDDHAADVLVFEQVGGAVGLLLRREVRHRDVPRAVGEQDHQRHHVRVGVLFLLEDFEGQRQPGGERGLAAHRDIGERALGEVHRVGRREDERGLVLLEDDQPHAVAALVGVGEQGHDRALGCGHALGHGHGPRSVHDEQDQVRRALDANLLLQVARLDGKRDLRLGALLCPLNLHGRGGAKGGVEGEVARLAVRGAGLDIAPALALGARARTAAALFAGQFVEGGIELARLKSLAGLDLLPALPPVRVAVVGEGLGLRLGLAVLRRRLFRGFLRYALFFFTGVWLDSAGCGSPSSPPVHSL